MSETLREHIDFAKLKIRRMQKKDIESVVRIEREQFKDAWKPEHFLFEIEEHPYSIPLILEYEGEIAAYMICWAMFEELHLANIAVSRKYQRQGLGKYLMDYIENSLILNENSIILEVRVSNLPAIKLYEKAGFKVYFERKHFYPDGENAYVMIKELNLDGSA